VHLLAFLTAFLVICVVGLVCLMHLLCTMFESELEPPDDIDDGSGTVGAMDNDQFDVRRHQSEL
jgi:hypothetical protein